MQESLIVHRFLQRALADVESESGLSPLATYLEAFPGYERAVRREYAALSRAQERDEARGDIGPTDGLESEVDPEQLAALVSTEADLDRRGNRLIGAYRILSEIGRGGQGRVLLAEDTRLERLVALKVLPIGATRAEASRLRREGEVAARIDDPHVCKVYEVGRSALGSYVAMQYVQGESLATRIAKSTKDTPVALLDEESGGRSGRLDRVLEYVERIARSLHAMHVSGVLHRDLKPHNIMVMPNGAPMILDFGLARVTVDDNGSEGALTRTGDVVGTPAYMAPELLADEPGLADAITDVWALAVVCWECVTGERPFVAAGREATIRAIRTGTLPRLANAAPWAPRELELVLRKALDPDRDRRYPSARALADELARIRRREPVLARGVGPLLSVVRFAQRRPVLATASGFSLALLVSVPFAVAVEARSGERLIRDEMQRTEAQRARAESRLVLALEAVDRGLVQIAADELNSSARIVDVRKRFYNDALQLLEGIRSELRDDDPAAEEVRMRLARIDHALGVLAARTSDFEDAVRHHSAALDVFEPIAQAGDEDAAGRVITSYVDLILAESSRANYDEALAFADRVQPLLARFGSEEQRITADLQVARTHERLGRHDLAHPMFRRIVELCDDHEDPNLRIHAIDARKSLIQPGEADATSGVSELRELLEDVTELAEALPGTRVQGHLADVGYWLGVALLDQHEWQQSYDVLQRGKVPVAELRRIAPTYRTVDVLDMRLDAAMARAAAGLERSDLAREHAAAAVGQAEEILADADDPQVNHVTAIGALYDVSRALRTLDLPFALDVLRRIDAAGVAMHERGESTAIWRLADARRGLAQQLRRSEGLARYYPLMERAIHAVDQVWAEQPQSFHYFQCVVGWRHEVSRSKLQERDLPAAIHWERAAFEAALARVHEAMVGMITKECWKLVNMTHKSCWTIADMLCGEGRWEEAIEVGASMHVMLLRFLGEHHQGGAKGIDNAPALFVAGSLLEAGVEDATSAWMPMLRLLATIRSDIGGHDPLTPEARRPILVKIDGLAQRLVARAVAAGVVATAVELREDAAFAELPDAVFR